MPFFRYQVEDAQGRQLSGQIAAADPAAAQAMLEQQGLRVRSLGGHLRTATAAARASAVNPGPASVPIDSTVRTGRSSDKELFLLFTQLGSLLKAGVNVQLGLSELRDRSRHPGIRQSLEEMASRVTEGRSLSEVMAKYPRIYPPDVVGTMAAGEKGGFIAEAAANVGTQRESSHRIRRTVTFFQWVLVGMIAVFPFSLSVVRGSLESIRQQDQAGGTLNEVDTLIKAIRTEAATVLPISVGLGLLAGLLLLGVMSDRLEHFRHRLAQSFPIVGGRVRAESLARFSWLMEKLSIAGIPPHEVFRLAVSGVPNMAMRQRLKASANVMAEDEKLSSAIERADVLDPDYVSIVQNGELTGDVPGALGTIARAQNNEREARDGSFGRLMTFVFYPIMAVVVILLAGYLYRLYGQGLIDILLKEDPS